jgi:hypothetical protein
MPMNYLEQLLQAQHFTFVISMSPIRMMAAFVLSPYARPSENPAAQATMF